MWRRARLFALSVRYTRPKQLLTRLFLKGKRSTLVRLDRLGLVAPPPDDPLKLRPPFPQPALPPRTHLVEHTAGGLKLVVLQQQLPLTVPVEWHREELKIGTRLELLNLHYMEYLEAVDDASFEALILDWLEHNPTYRVGYWLDCWSSYALSIRCVVWLQQIARRGAGLSEALQHRVARAVAQQIRFLNRNLETDIGGNHLIKNIKALLWAGRCFEGSEARGWMRRGERLLLRELQEQVLEDGLHFERSPAYHVQVFADLLECYQVLGPGPTRDELGARLKPMAQAAADLTHPDGDISLFNDGGLHMTYPPGDVLAIHQQLTKRSVSARAVFELPAAGYFGARYGDTYLLADCGAIAPDFLPVHGHGDILAFEWSVRGRRIFVDAGVTEYHPGKWRDLSRATTSHNTVTLDDESQCEFWSAFRVGRRARVRVEQFQAGESGFVLVGSHDGYRHMAGAPIHRRLLAVQPTRVEVEDVVEGGAGQTVMARLLCHPECRVEPVEDGLRIRRNDVAVELATACRVDVTDGWWFPDFGVRRETRQIVLRYGVAPCRARFVLTVMGESPAS